MVASKEGNGRIGAYLLPNLITTGNLFWGFFSIVKSLQGQYAWAASAVFLAAIFDMLDGRVARMTGGTSEFGVQYDSLCDLVSFGLAPAFLTFQYGLHELGRIGWIVGFIFLACGALRLARFNVQSSRSKTTDDFVGLPIPMAALVPASLILLTEDILAEEGGFAWVGILQDFLLNSDVPIYILLALTALCALAMVSNIKYFSHKSVRFGRLNLFQLLSLVVLIVGIVDYQPELFAVLISVGYAVSGPIEFLLGWKTAEDDDDDLFTEPGNGQAQDDGSGSASRLSMLSLSDKKGK